MRRKAIDLGATSKNTIRWEAKKMKVILINGSPRIGGNCSIALSQARQIFEREGVEVKIYELGGKTSTAASPALPAEKADTASSTTW